MSSKLSVAEILAGLEARVAHHEERERFHAAQEAHHREERTAHAAELEKARQTLDSFRAVASSAVDLARPLAAPEPPPLPAEAESKRSGRLMPSRLIRAVVESRGTDPFQATDIAAEVNRRYGAKLSQPVDSRAAGDILRRMKAEGTIHVVRKGTAYYETHYAKGPQPTEG
jgi:hypothetical protein